MRIFDFYSYLIRRVQTKEIIRNRDQFNRKLYSTWQINVEEEGWDNQDQIERSVLRAAVQFNAKVAWLYFQNPLIRREELKEKFARESADVDFDFDTLLQISPLTHDADADEFRYLDNCVLAFYFGQYINEVLLAPEQSAGRSRNADEVYRHAKARNRSEIESTSNNAKIFLARGVRQKIQDYLMLVRAPSADLTIDLVGLVLKGRHDYQRLSFGQTLHSPILEHAADQISVASYVNRLSQKYTLRRQKYANGAQFLAEIQRLAQTRLSKYHASVAGNSPNEG